MAQRTRIKICGIRDDSAAFWAVEAGADALGFVFHPASPRNIDPEDAWELIGLLPPFVSSVGLFVNASVDHFSQIEETCPTDLSQLHGEETEDVVRRCGPNIIKAVRFDSETIERELTRWGEVDEVSAILIDGSAGGEGASFAWDGLAQAMKRLREREAWDKPVIVAGGLTPENVGEAVRAIRPWAVDVSSGVESSRGVKDKTKIEAFCRAVRAADAAQA